jgi:rRNA biogenesis protein RRP5
VDMSAIKRKAEANGALPKKAQSDPNRPAKRQKQDSKLNKDKKRGKTEIASTPQISILQKEEKSFPRGGASALTPLEHRQIQIEATKDVLFEQSGSKRRPANSDTDDDLENSRLESPQAPKKKKRRKESHRKKDKDAEEVEEKQTKIEGLSAKRLLPGTIVLGRVAQITSKDLVLDLPNNLHGYVPLTDISDQLNCRIEKLLEETNADTGDNESESDPEDINLKNLFRIGQFLRAYITSIGSEGTTSGKKRIDLSLNPRLANHGVKKADLVPCSSVQASVVSIEDHGLVMDLALEDGKVKGFISSKEIDRQKHTEVEEGTVLLCMILGSNSDGGIVKLSADHQRIGNVKKSNFLSTASSVRAFTPGTAVEVLVSDVTDHGIRGSLMGMVDVTADIVHSGVARQKDMPKRLSVGSKIKGRIIFSLPKDDHQALGVSLLDSTVQLQSDSSSDPDSENERTELSLSSIVEEANVIRVQSHLGIFLDLGASQALGFAHISRISDKKIDSLSSGSGSYKVGSKHRARIIGFNSTDGLYIVSLEQSTLDQPFLRVEDVPVGDVIKGTIEKIVVNDRGVGGLLVKLAEGISGLVPEMHMADVHLQHPERKFREGMPVKVRVLSTNPEKRQIRLTLKKTLVNSDIEPWLDYHKIKVGAQSPGTLVNVLQDGAVVQFYGSIRGFLPVSEMSEAYVEDAREHFRVGQAVTVRVAEIDPEKKQMRVSCKDPGQFEPEQVKAFEKFKVGALVKGSIVEIATDLVSLELENGIKAILKLRHLADGSEAKCRSLMKKFRVGQTLSDLVILDKLDKRRVIVVSNKPNLVRSALAGKICTKFDDLKKGSEYVGFIRNITDAGVFIEFLGAVVALLPALQMTEEMRKQPKFGLEIGETITARVFSVDSTTQKAYLTMKDHSEAITNSEKKSAPTLPDGEVVNAVDGISTTHSDFSLGKQTKAKISSIKDTQLNVYLADNVQGRIDVSELFDDWNDIRNRKKPLESFKKKQILDVRVIGIHDTKSRRFLPFSHRTGHSVYELSAKNMSSDNPSVLTLNDLKVGEEVSGFVNSHGDGCLWVNLSPSVRGRVSYMDLSQDVSVLNDVHKNFPIGAAIRLVVRAIDINANRLDLAPSGVSSKITDVFTLETLPKDTMLTGRVTKILDRGLLVQVNNSVAGMVPLTELSDDYDHANPKKYSKNDILKVKVVDIDLPNKKVTLSCRDSQIVSSSLPVKDRQIMSLSDVHMNDVLRGFVRNVTDKGILVSLGPTVSAFVRVSELSDDYIKDWRSAFTVDQLVKGKIIKLDPKVNQVQMTLKASALDKNYIRPLGFEDLKERQIVTAKIRKVEPYGVFIVVDNSSNLSGLCHRSEISDNKVDDVTKLYEVGDAVKAIVLRIDKGKRRVNFGLKASYFKNETAKNGVESSDDEDFEGLDDDDSSAADLDEIIDPSSREVLDAEDVEEEEVSHESHDKDSIGDQEEPKGLSVGGFDWTGGLMDQNDGESEDEAAAHGEKKKKKRRPEIQEDRTGELDKFGPRAVADFERLLLGKPNDSATWIQYMAFQLGLGEVDKARAIAERALKTINLRDQDEKLNVWIALLNLENTYGTEDSVDEVFNRACEYQDKNDMHERLASIFIESGHPDVSVPHSSSSLSPFIVSLT